MSSRIFKDIQYDRERALQTTHVRSTSCRNSVRLPAGFPVNKRKNYPKVFGFFWSPKKIQYVGNDIFKWEQMLRSCRAAHLAFHTHLSVQARASTVNSVQLTVLADHPLQAAMIMFHAKTPQGGTLICWKRFIDFVNGNSEKMYLP